MPLYEYRCAVCGREIEILQSIGADATGLACPDCGAERLVRQLSTFSGRSSSSSESACSTPGCASPFT